MPNSGPYFKCRIHLGSTRYVRARRTDGSRLNVFTGRHPTDRADRSCSRSVSKIGSGTRMAEACACRFRKRGVLKGRKSPGCFFRISTGRTGCGHLVPSPDRFPSIPSESRLKPNPIQDLSGNSGNQTLRQGRDIPARILSSHDRDNAPGLRSGYRSTRVSVPNASIPCPAVANRWTPGAGN